MPTTTPRSAPAVRPSPPSLRSRLARVVLPAVLAPAEILLVGPAVLWSGNREELTHGLAELLPILVAPFLAVWLLLTALGVVLARRFPAATPALLFGLGIAAWLTGSVMIGDYGVLDGRTIDWAAQPQRLWLDALVWLGIPVLAMLARRKLSGVAGTATVALLAVQTAGALLVTPSAPATADDERDPRKAGAAPDAGLFQFSTEKNGLLLVLDAFQSDAFAEMTEAAGAEADTLRDAFAGFTFFADHTGAFPNTRPSIPAMLSGLRYDNVEPLPAYYRRSQRQSIIPALANAGWQVDMVSLVGRFLRGPLRHRYRLPRPFASAEDIRFAEAAQLLDLSLFRHAPRALKPWIYNDQEWRVGRLSKLAQNVHHASNGRDFLAHFTDRAEVVPGGPVFKIVHVGIPHMPNVVDADCQWIGVHPNRREHYLEQSRCAVRLTAALFDKLRRLGIFDDMLIVVAADHGTEFLPRVFQGDAPRAASMSWIVGRAMPLLLVKPPGASAPFTVSQAPTTITDVPATIAGQLGLPGTFPGTPVFDIDPKAPRSRRYDAYFWEDVRWPAKHFPFAHRFAIEGPVRAASSWRFLETAYVAGTRLPAGRIAIGQAASRDQLGLGWSKPSRSGDETIRWGLGERAMVHASLDPGPQRLRARLRVPRFIHPQTIEVRVDGVTVATWTPGDEAMNEWSAAVPAGERPPVSVIELRFARTATYESDLRPLAAEVSWLEIVPNA